MNNVMKKLLNKFSAFGRNLDYTPHQSNGSPKYEGSPTTSEVDDFFFPQIAMYTGEAWTPEYASDPSAWEQLFLRHWASLSNLLLMETRDKKLLCLVQDDLSKICLLLVTEVNSQPEPSIGLILDHFFNEDILLIVHDWALKMPMSLIPLTQIMLIRMFEILVNKTHSQSYCLFVHKPILVPLLALLKWCSCSLRQRKSSQPGCVDKYFVLLLNQICRKIAGNSTLLHFFFYSVTENSPVKHANNVNGFTHGNGNENETPRKGRDEENSAFLVFDLLIPYLYAPGDVGQLARDALLLIMSVSKDYDFIAQYVALESNFCPVLATGLSGFYSELPRSVCSALNGVDFEEFHKFTHLDVDPLPELCAFQDAILFCNAVVQVAETQIVRSLLIYFSGGFLNVFKSAFSEKTLLDEEDLISDILYFHLCIETVTEPAFIHSFIKVLIVGDSKSNCLIPLEVILSKMNSSERLYRVVLSLLHTLFELRCEDFMWNTILRYILPFISLKPNTRKFDANISLNASSFFLSCIPKCARPIKELNSSESFQEFLHSTAKSISETERCCEKWAFKYDGSTPNSLLNIGPTNELLSTRQPFVRLSSARSSYTSSGWNRYFQNRHGTFDGGDLSSFSSGMNVLNPLGESDPIDSNPFDTSADELNDLSPQYELMTESCLDYFHFTYDGLSESDEASQSHSRKGSCRGDEDNKECLSSTAPVTAVTNVKAKPVSSEFIKSVIKTNWPSAKTQNDFIRLLDELPAVDKQFKKSSTVEENVALIEARHQYLEELRHEKMRAEQETNGGSHINPFKLNLEFGDKYVSGESNGLLLTCTDEKGSGILLEVIMDAITRMPEHNFATNLKILDLMSFLCSYPQPVLTSYLLYVDSIQTNALYRLTNVINELSVRIDAYASSISDFDELIRRGVKSAAFKNRVYPENERSPSDYKRSARLKHYRLVYDQTTEDRELSRAKNFAYAAICLSQLCQMLAAFALQHCTTIDYTKGLRSSNFGGSRSSRQ